MKDVGNGVRYARLGRSSRRECEQEKMCKKGERDKPNEP